MLPYLLIYIHDIAAEGKLYFILIQYNLRDAIFLYSGKFNVTSFSNLRWRLSGEEKFPLVRKIQYDAKVHF